MKSIFRSILISLLLLIANASAQSINVPPAPKAKNIRLYVMDCGTLIYNHPETYNLTRSEVADTIMSDACYLVVHPRGLLLFDTGLSDTIVGRPVYENPIGDFYQLKIKSLRGQLADIGVTPEKITYLALSHGHSDHVGNANDYASSTWLTPKAEKDYMFSDEAKHRWYFGEYASLYKSKTITYDGDYDVFGDGAVILKATPGHTPGHQVLYVKLESTGGVVLSGDLYHYPEERTLNRIPDSEKSTSAAASRAAIEDFLKKTNSQLWICHDINLFKNQIKSPGWYD